MTGFDSKRKIALDRLDDDDIQVYAQPSNGPVAWGFRSDDGAIYDCISPEAHADCEGEYTVPLYAALPAAQPAQEPEESEYIGVPVAYQYAYPDGTWSFSFGDEINGCKPIAPRALYAKKDGK